MRRVVAMLVVGLVIAGCGPGVASSPTPTDVAVVPTASTVPATSPALTDPDPTPTPVPEVTPTAEPSCPATEPTSVAAFVDSRVRCWSGAELSFRGWLDYSPPLGFEGPLVEPVWLPYPPSGQVWALWSVPPVGEDNLCPDARPDCAWLALHIDPSSDVVFGTTARWVRVTGHVDDPAAMTCHWVFNEDYPDDGRPDSDAIEWCRNSFIVDTIRTVE